MEPQPIKINGTPVYEIIYSFRNQKEFSQSLNKDFAVKVIIDPTILEWNIQVIGQIPGTEIFKTNCAGTTLFSLGFLTLKELLTETLVKQPDTNGRGQHIVETFNEISNVKFKVRKNKFSNTTTKIYRRSIWLRYFNNKEFKDYLFSKLNNNEATLMTYGSTLGGSHFVLICKKEGNLYMYDFQQNYYVPYENIYKTIRLQSSNETFKAKDIGYKGTNKEKGETSYKGYGYISDFSEEKVNTLFVSFFFSDEVFYKGTGISEVHHSKWLEFNNLLSNDKVFYDVFNETKKQLMDAEEGPSNKEEPTNEDIIDRILEEYFIIGTSDDTLETYLSQLDSPYLLTAAKRKAEQTGKSVQNVLDRHDKYTKPGINELSEKYKEELSEKIKEITLKKNTIEPSKIQIRKNKGCEKEYIEFRQKKYGETEQLARYSYTHLLSSKSPYLLKLRCEEAKSGLQVDFKSIYKSTYNKMSSESSSQATREQVINKIINDYESTNLCDTLVENFLKVHAPDLSLGVKFFKINNPKLYKEYCKKEMRKQMENSMSDGGKRKRRQTRHKKQKRKVTRKHK
jgi:hypothetical protein